MGHRHRCLSTRPPPAAPIGRRPPPPILNLASAPPSSIPHSALLQIPHFAAADYVLPPRKPPSRLRPTPDYGPNLRPTPPPLPIAASALALPAATTHPSALDRRPMLLLPGRRRRGSLGSKTKLATNCLELAARRCSTSAPSPQPRPGMGASACSCSGEAAAVLPLDHSIRRHLCASLDSRSVMCSPVVLKHDPVLPRSGTIGDYVIRIHSTIIIF